MVKQQNDYKPKVFVLDGHRRLISSKVDEVNALAAGWVEETPKPAKSETK